MLTVNCILGFALAHFEHHTYHQMVELLGSANIKESINRAYLADRSEPVYGPNGEKKKAYFVN